MKRFAREAAVLMALAMLGLTGCGGSGDADMAQDENTGMPSAEAPAAAPDMPAAGTEALIDPNDASREDLMAAGLTAEQADAVIAGRPYSDMLAVDRVLTTASVDSAGRDAIYRRVWHPIDLNTASGEEILLIPGAGTRMRREFLEYRPYDNIEKFRREIGKYVDDAEVARLERYVTIR